KRVTPRLEMPFQQPWPEREDETGRCRHANGVEPRCHRVKERETSERQQNRRYLQRDHSDAGHRERNDCKVRFPCAGGIVGDAVEIKWKIAALENVFRHQPDDRFITGYVGLRDEQNDETNDRRSDKDQKKRQMPPHGVESLKPLNRKRQSKTNSEIGRQESPC